MCGIVGIFGRINKARVNMFEEMLAMDALRGVDSTGICVVKSDEVFTIKDTVLPNGLLVDTDYKKIVKEAPMCLIGHNRAATKGAISAENAHPFTHKHITLVHNGTLDDAWRLPKYWKFGTDSEAIAYAIAEHGIEKVWPVLNGAATLVFWDDTAKTLNVISNNKRPFYLQPLKNKDGLVWSSERWTLLTAALRTGVQFEDVAKVHTPANDMLYTFQLKPEGVFTFTEKKLKTFQWGNTLEGYVATPPKKKKKKTHGQNTSTNIVPFKSAEASANVFQEWKQERLNKLKDMPPDKYSDEQMRKDYPELFATQDNRTDADLDTRAVPFRNTLKPNPRTAERFKQLFNLVEINGKYERPEWFLTTYAGCSQCETPFDYNDYFTARVLSATSAICALCQSDIWVTSGMAPNEIRQQ